MIVPLMIANLVSVFISSRLQQPIYEALEVQDGIHLPKAEPRRQQRNRQVARIMRAATELLPGELSVRDALEQIRSSKFRTCLVTDKLGLLGVVNLAALAE